MDRSAVAHGGSSSDASPASFVLDSDDSPLKGVKYSALVGPGPTGCRPEHFRDMLSVPRRADANRLLRALSTFHKCIDSGSLPDACRFITRTRLMWQRKKNGKPRPIKMGEVLRSCYAKHLVLWYTSTRSNFAPRACPWTNGALVFQAPLRRCPIGAVL